MLGVSGFLLLGVGFIGVLLLLAGLQGRRVSDALFCRRCGYELSGLWSKVCPECGRSLVKLWAVRQGRRQARRLPVAAGLVVLCAVLIGGGALGYSAWSGVPINRFKPTWLLMLEVQGGHLEEAEAAAAELARRELNDRLQPRQRERLLAFALERHARTEKEWLGDLDPVIARAFFEERMTRQPVKTYLRNLAAPSLVYGATEPLWPGEVFRVDCQVTWRSGPSRAGSPYRWAFRHAAVLEQESVEEVGVPVWFMPHDGVRTFRAGHFRAAEEAGTHQLRGVVRFELCPLSYDDAVLASLPESLRDVAVEWPVELEYVVEDAGAGMPDLMADESIGEAIREAITDVQASVFAVRNTLGGMLLIRTEPLPANVSFDVFWWDGEREWPFIELTARQGGTFAYGVGGRQTLDGFDAEKVDVILRTNPGHIRDRRRSFDWLWDGEIVIRDVPVTRGE